MTAPDDDDGDATFAGMADLFMAVVAVLLVLITVQHREGVPAKAEYVVSAEWDRTVDADVDLYGLQESGGVADPSARPVYFSNKEAGNLFLDRDSRGFMDDRIKREDGTWLYLPHREVMTVRGVLPGDYTFGLHLYAFRRDYRVDNEERHADVQVHVEIVRLNPHVEVVFSGDETLNYAGDAVNFAKLVVLPDGSPRVEEPYLTPLSDRVFAHGGTDFKSQPGAGYTGGYTPGGSQAP